MAQAFVVKTVVFTERLYAGRGDVRVWVDRITSRFTRETQKYVAQRSTRSGRMLRGISHSTRGNPAAHKVAGTWYSRAPYTNYVLRGTTGPIQTDKHFVNPAGAYKKQLVTMPDGRRVVRKVRQKGYFMPIPDRATNKFAPPGLGHFARTVNGQEAHNFLERAWRATARDHRAIRGKGVPRFISHP